MTARSKGKVAEARARVFRLAGLVAVAKSAGLSRKWHRVQSVFESIHRLKSVPLGGELRQGAGCFTAQKFLESEGPVVCFAIGPFCISLCPPW